MKLRKVLLLGALIGAVVGVAVGVIVPRLFITEPSGIFSKTAFISNGPVEIISQLAGPLEFAAPEGKQIKKGELLAQINGSAYEEAVRQAEEAVRLETNGLNPGAVAMVRGYRAIPGSLEEIAAQIDAAAAANGKMADKVAGLSERHGNLQIRMRALELKNNPDADEKTRIKALAVEEELTAKALELAREERELAELARYELEKRLREKKGYEAALRNIPAQEMEKFVRLEELLQELEGAEKELARCRITAPGDGIVLFVYAKTGLDAGQGQLLMLFLQLPEEGEPLRVTANFSQEDSAKIVPGMLARVALEVELPEVLEGRILEMIGPTGPDAEPDAASGQGGVSFSVALERQPDTVAGLVRKGQRAWVRIPPEEFKTAETQVE